MVSREKLKNRLLARPTPRDIRWSELRKLLHSLGFEEMQGSGSRVRFFKRDRDRNRGLMIRLHRPHPRSVCGPLMVEDVVRKLKQWGEI